MCLFSLGGYRPCSLHPSSTDAGGSLWGTERRRLKKPTNLHLLALGVGLGVGVSMSNLRGWFLLLIDPFHQPLKILDFFFFVTKNTTKQKKNLYFSSSVLSEIFIESLSLLAIFSYFFFAFFPPTPLSSSLSYHSTKTELYLSVVQRKRHYSTIA